MVENVLIFRGFNCQ